MLKSIVLIGLIHAQVAYGSEPNITINNNSCCCKPKVKTVTKVVEKVVERIVPKVELKTVYVPKFYNSYTVTRNILGLQLTTGYAGLDTERLSAAKVRITEERKFGAGLFYLHNVSGSLYLGATIDTLEHAAILIGWAL